MKKFLAIAAIGLVALGATAKEYVVASPDNKIVVTVNTTPRLSWSISDQGQAILLPSELGVTLADGQMLGQKPVVKKATKKSVNGKFGNPYYKRQEIAEKYNQLKLDFKGDYSLTVRAYDDGAAYRFSLCKKADTAIKDELAEFNFADDYMAFVPYVNDNRGGDRWSYSFESYYDEQPISQMYVDSLAIVPLMVDLGQRKKAVIMEGGLENYPGMYLIKNDAKSNSLVAQFPPEILDGYWGGYMRMNWISSRRGDAIAHVPGKFEFPWRAVVVSRNDAALLQSDMAQLLAPACRIHDTSWIQPGLVSWDWWNTTNVSGVDFKAGMNTPTYEYFIDFASDNGIPYIIIDAGWSGTQADWKGESLLSCTPDIDLEHLIAYGNERNVGIILWASWALTQKEKDIAFPHYAQMGIKGFKVDFLDRDDQAMVQSMWDIAKTAADNKLLLDLHGMRPSGIQRAYPNIVNFEGVKGLENTKWAAMYGDVSRDDFLRYDVTIPYIRMMAGPMDYTPGAMTNKAQHYFRPVNDHPMSQGTRVHQMAMYIIYDAPLQMLADSPTAYMKNQECTDFIASVPTVWDETIGLGGQVGEYAAIARQKGDNWHVGVLNNWTPRDIEIDFSFLPSGITYEAEIFTDGVNADKEGTDYKRQTIKVDSATLLPIHLAPGGGAAIRLAKLAALESRE